MPSRRAGLDPPALELFRLRETCVSVVRSQVSTVLHSDASAAQKGSPFAISRSNNSCCTSSLCCWLPRLGLPTFRIRRYLLPRSVQPFPISFARYPPPAALARRVQGKKGVRRLFVDTECPVSNLYVPTRSNCTTVRRQGGEFLAINSSCQDSFAACRPMPRSVTCPSRCSRTSISGWRILLGNADTRGVFA